MTKNEQIEEMVSIMAVSNNPFVDVPIEIMPKAAEALYNAGYRKIDDDRAVITKSELKQYNVQAVKEFAEKLKELLHNDYIMPSGITDERCVFEGIDELLRWYEK